LLNRKEIRAYDDAVIFQIAGAVAEVCSELCMSVGVVSLSDVLVLIHRVSALLHLLEEEA